MKKLIVLLIVLLLSNIAWSQAPGEFNYQTVVRDNNGDLISNQSVDIKISILNETASGSILFTETHTKTTDDFGLVNLKIGSIETASFAVIDWSLNDKYLNIEIDIGNGFNDMGAVQLLSVPYALFANNVANKDDADADPTNEIQDLNLAGNILTITNNASATQIDLSNPNVYTPATDTLFVVKDHDGKVVFAVFPDGAQVIVNESAKGKVGGFAVSGRSPTKSDQSILAVTVDSTRIYVNDTVTAKGKVGGFAVSGRSPTKNLNTDLLFVTADSTRVYVNENTKTKGKVGGFAVSGRSPTKGVSGHMFVTTMDSTRIFTQDSIGGFGVLDNSKGNATSYMKLTPLNYFIGHESGELVEHDTLNPGMGKYNTFFGYKTGKNTVSGFKNIFMGYQAGIANISGGWNIFIGNEAGLNSQSGLSNIFIGDQAGYNFSNGIQNVFLGNKAGYSSSTNVYNNLFVGNSAGRNNVSGNYNAYIGISAGYNTLGSNNTFVGNISGFGSWGEENTYLGSESGFDVESGVDNVCIGYRAGYRSTGSGNVFVGHNANNTNFSNVDYSNCIAIGDSTIVTGDNQIQIGNANSTSFYAQGIYNTTTANTANLYMYASGRIVRSTSSKRYKKDIKSLEVNTSDIYKLNPVSFTSLSDNKQYFGLIAEEVAEVIPQLAEFARKKDVIPGSTSEDLIPDAVQYSKLSVLLLCEVQKHESVIKNQQSEIEELKAKNEALENKLNEIIELFNTK